MDGLVIMGGVEIVVNTAMAIGLFYVGSKANKIDELEARLEKKQDERLNEKFADMQKRLDHGDGEFESIAEKNQKMEIRIERIVSDFKEFVRTTCATREDMKDHEKSVDSKFTRLENETHQLGTNVAVLSSQIKKGAS